MTERSHPGVTIDHPHDDAAEENEQKVFGFWIFLMSDAVLFALLFATYAVLLVGTAGGPSGHDLFDLKRAFFETLALLTSSLCFGFATLAMRDGAPARRVAAWLLVTLALGGVFLALEVTELLGLIDQGAGPSRSGFLSAFFTLVGTHGLHVSIGSLWIVFMLVQMRMKGLTPPVRSRILRLGLYWHFLDIVWVGIFSVVYLPGIL